jgi:4-hydroxybenzoate polyprenyltransferase
MNNISAPLIENNVRSAATQSPRSQEIGPAVQSVSSLIRLIRPHQWAKNVLLLVPMLMAHRIFDLDALFHAGLAFFSFSAAASAGYIFNDLRDVSADRRHPSKRSRPIAAGEVSVSTARWMAAGLLFLAVIAGTQLPWGFDALLLLYLLLTVAYSLYIKRKLMADVVCLAGLYALRVLAGGAATSIYVSPWLLAFSMFLFLSLAFIKRYTELLDRAAEASPPNVRIVGRGYMPSDIDLIRSMGPSCGHISVLVICLYINNKDLVAAYRRPEVLWLICPILLYWISRLWFLADRSQLPHDPIVFALRDRISFIAGLLILAILTIAV